MGGLMSGVENSINSNIVDIINHSNSVVMNDIHKLNDEFYEGYQWIAALDSATCLACAELDNKIFDKLPGMKGEGTEPPTEPPLHKNCRCIIVPVLEGMKDDPSQTQINYKDWFERQDEKIKLDILGPSRYKEYLNGKEITGFAKDGHITTLKEMGIDRITRKQLFENDTQTNNEDVQTEQSFNPKPKPISNTLQNTIKAATSDNPGENIPAGAIDARKNKEKQLSSKPFNNNLYPKYLSKQEIIDRFKERWPGMKFNLGNFTKDISQENLRMFASTFDELLVQHPQAMKTFNKIEISNILSDPKAAAEYDYSKRKITFHTDYTKDYLLGYHSQPSYSTNSIKHGVVHEFGHAVSRAYGLKNKVWGTDALISKFSDYDWEIIGNEYVSRYGIHKKGEFFAEAFAKYKTGGFNSPQNGAEKRIYDKFIDFFDNLSL